MLVISIKLFFCLNHNSSLRLLNFGSTSQIHKQSVCLSDQMSYEVVPNPKLSIAL